jgi:hypothetical protein
VILKSETYNFSRTSPSTASAVAARRFGGAEDATTVTTAEEVAGYVSLGAAATTAMTVITDGLSKLKSAPHIRPRS